MTVPRPDAGSPGPSGRRVARLPTLRAVGGAAGRVAGEREALMSIAAATADAYRLEDVMEQAAEAALEITGAASLSISKWERDDDAMRTLINVGQLGPHEQRFPIDELYPLAENPVVAKLLRDGEPYRTATDDPDASPAAVAILKELDKESDLGVPILLDGEVWGEVWATTAPGAPHFDDGDVRFLQAIADRLSLVLARAERFSKVSRLAYEDPLTGLANRRAIAELLDELIEQRTTPDRPFTLLLADVDGLKDINDARGHHVGDHALCRVGEALVAAAAPETAALVGRLSGDEFCVLLEGCELDSAGKVASTALELLADGGDPPLTLSFGAATAKPGITPAELLHAADTAQYAAKRRGGGRLCSADAETLAAAAGASAEIDPRDVEARLEATTERTMRMLDDELSHHRVLDRIEAVVVAFAPTVNAPAWTISRWERGSSMIRSVSTANDRDSRLRGLRLGLENEVYRVDDFPETARVLGDGRGSFVADVADPGVDPCERELLSELGFTGALNVAVRHGSGAYLAELYADEQTADLAVAAVRMQLLLRLAAAPRTAS